MPLSTAPTLDPDDIVALLGGSMGQSVTPTDLEVVLFRASW